MKPILLTLFFFCSLSAPLFAGGPMPGDGGLQIVFSDNGVGGTRVTASGSGTSDDDGDFMGYGLGFADGGAVGTNDLVDPNPPGTPTYPNFGLIAMDTPIVLNLSTYGDISLESLFSIPLEFGFGMPTPEDRVTGTETLTVVSGTANAPINYSTFAALHGRTLASTDGFTFVFDPPIPSAEACADKSQLKRKIKKLKKKLKNAKRAGNISGAAKLKKKLKKLKKKLKALC